MGCERTYSLKGGLDDAVQEIICTLANTAHISRHTSRLKDGISIGDDHTLTGTAYGCGPRCVQGGGHGQSLFGGRYLNDCRSRSQRTRCTDRAQLLHSPFVRQLRASNPDGPRTYIVAHVLASHDAQEPISPHSAAVAKSVLTPSVLCLNILSPGYVQLLPIDAINTKPGVLNERQVVIMTQN